MVIKVLFVIVVIFLIHSIIPTIYNKKINKNVRRVSPNGDSVILTFDDGPDPRYTYRLLDVLDENNIKAIFFMVAENAKNNKDVVMEVKRRGHKIGLHSWQHRNALFYSYFYTKKDFENSCKIMASMGIDEIYYRPPWGLVNMFSNHFARKYNMKIIYWSVMAEDWSSKSTPETIEAKLMERVKPNSIICLHDAGENTGGAKGAPNNTIDALKKALPRLKEEKGYNFTIDL